MRLYICLSAPVLCSLCATCVTSLSMVLPATLHIVRSDFVGHSPTEQGTSLRAGWNCRRPSRRSRYFYQLHSWTATQRPCWQTRQPQRGNSVNSCLIRLVSLIDSASLSILLSLTRYLLSYFLQVFVMSHWNMFSCVFL